MPFHLGEVVNLRFEGPHDTSRLIVGGTAYTVENGLLNPQRDGALTANVQLPSRVGQVPYTFLIDDTPVEEGILRVVDRSGSLPADVLPAGTIPAPATPAAPPVPGARPFHIR
jgi:hypothetical protein